MSALQENHGSDEGREPVRHLAFSASLRAESLNSRLAQLAAQTIEQHNGTVDLVALSDFDTPSYDQDIQDTAGFPLGAEKLCRRLEAQLPQLRLPVQRRQTPSQ